MTLKEIAEKLGAKAAGLADLASLTHGEIRVRLRKDLLAVARWCELKGATKMTKTELAAAILGALKDRAGLASKPASRPAAPRTKAAPKSAPVPAEPEEQALAEGADPSGTAKLDIGPAGKAEKPVATIPWSYGHDRVIAAAVDPDRLYVHWEVTDGAIEKARAGLGAGGPGAWLNLRVHDTTDVLFDGSNAHSTYDHRIDRSDRQWFLDVNKPTSSCHVEVGMLSSEGYFVRIARSGRVDFPRKEAAPWSEPEWLTVVPMTGEVRGAGTGSPSQPGGPGSSPGGTHGGPGGPGPGPGPGPGGGAVAAGFDPIAIWMLHESGEQREQRIAELLAQGWERVEWREEHGEGWYELHGRAEWMGPLTTSSWEAGPFEYPVEVEPPAREEWHGPSVAFKVGGVTHVIRGPWQVVIRNLGAHQERAVLGRWEVFRSWVDQAGGEIRRDASGPVATPGASDQHIGASERRWLSGSELRLGGASELWRLGASEIRLGGASELLFAGASERRLGGASERQYAGASEWVVRGGSELRLGGASELLRQGASERRLAGGSEGRLGGASEQVGGGATSVYPRIEE